MDIASITAIVAGVCSVIVGLLVAWSDPRQAVRRNFCLCIVGTGLWSIALSLLFTTHDYFYSQFTFYSALPCFGGLLLFALTYSTPEKPLPPGAYWSLLPLAVVSLCVPAHLYVTSVSVTASGTLAPVNGPLMPLFALTAIAYFFASLYFFARHFHKARGQARLRLWYLIAGLCLLFGGAVLSASTLPSLGIHIANVVLPLTVLCFALLMAYAIVRHQLMDIRVVVQRGLIYVVVLALIIGLYLTLVNILGFVLGKDFDAVLISGLIATLAGIFGVPPIAHYFRRITDPIFFKDTYDYAEVLRRLSETLHRNVDFTAMSQQAREVLVDTFHPEQITLEESGEIIVGPKRSGDPYTPQDDKLLTTFSHQAATAFERARLFSEVTRHAQELEQKVHERTEELREAHESQRHLLLDISHGFQTPLAVIRLRLEQLKQTMPGDSELQSFEDSLTDLSSFIYQLLTLAQLEYGRDKPNVMEFSLSDLVTDIAQEVSIIAAPQSIGVQYELEPGILMRGNAEKIRDAVLNLASNAIKYMGSGSGGITFSLHTEAEHVILTVADTGLGIAPEHVSHIFERFYRVPQTRTQGSGLGLAITKQIIETHGGSIEASSIPGVGTTITLRIPRIS